MEYQGTLEEVEAAIKQTARHSPDKFYQLEIPSNPLSSTETLLVETERENGENGEEERNCPLLNLC